MPFAARTIDPRRVVATVALVFGIAASAGCGSPAASGPPASPRVSCTGIPAAKCDEAVASVARSLPNSRPVSIDVTCVSGSCTPQSGAMDTVVTLADGSVLRSSTLSWSEPDAGAAGGDGANPATAAPAAPPGLSVQPTCQGVPAAMCATMAETAFGELSTEAVVAILVRCTELPCSPQHGTGDTIVTYADGTTRSSSWEYAGN